MPLYSQMDAVKRYHSHSLYSCRNRYTYIQSHITMYIYIYSTRICGAEYNFKLGALKESPQSEL